MNQLNWVQVALQIIAGDPNPKRRAALLGGVLGLAAIVAVSGAVASLSHGSADPGPSYPDLSSPSYDAPDPYTNQLLEQMRQDDAANQAYYNQLLEQMRQDDETTNQMLRQMRGAP